MQPNGPRPLARGARRGIALPTALTLLVILTLIASGAFAMSRQTFRGGRNALVEQRALAVAEFGLNQRIANWDRRLNLPSGAAGGISIGKVDSSSLYVAATDTARVRIVRLDSVLYFVESLGRASIPSPQLQSQRSVTTVVRLAYPSINPRGALTVNGNVSLQGSALVDGKDNIPYTWGGKDADKAWDPARCVGITGPNTWAVVVPPGGKVDDKPGNYEAGSLTWTTDPAAGDSNTYVRYGTESWNTLAANANIRLAGGTYGSDIMPSESSPGQCDMSQQFNWGEPFGPAFAGGVASCRTYFPIIYIDGSATLNGKGRGQGILLVNGDLRINGTFDWVGLVIIRDDLNKGTGAATVSGAILARNIDLSDASIVTGNQTVQYSRCAVESALRGSAVLVRARDRSWAQLF